MIFSGIMNNMFNYMNLFEVEDLFSRFLNNTAVKRKRTKAGGDPTNIELPKFLSIQAACLVERPSWYEIR